MTSTYFQGGDYVELLSAQGKAPAATWKLHGKIHKAFDKHIRGNAFQLDGSAETKMQLPKTTSTTHSLGLTQRFVIFQLLVPFTRSFSIEIGFSDFQKIRRRFVFASAFRETARTSLHVQIPFDAQRDAWRNLVFDLQALTEAYFPGSTFRSMESICISGSCRLKRVFTMKDAPRCDVETYHQLLDSGSATATALPTHAAAMHDIPKQFVFASDRSNGPIPTEYVVVASAPRALAVVGSASAAGGGGSSRNAATTAARSTARAKTAAATTPTTARVGGAALRKTRAVTATANATRPTHRSMRGASAAAVVPAACAPAMPAWQELTSHDNEPTTTTLASASPSSGVQQQQRRPDTAQLTRSAATARSTASPLRVAAPTSIRRSREDIKERSPSSTNSSKDSDSDDFRRSQDDALESARSPAAAADRTSVSHSPVDCNRNNASAASDVSTTINKVDRRAILAQIQQTLDVLSDDDEYEAARNSRLFLRHTSIDAPDATLFAFDPDDDDDETVDRRTGTVVNALEAIGGDGSSRHSSREEEDESSRSADPHKSIFSIALPSDCVERGHSYRQDDDIDDDIDDAALHTTTSRSIPSLFNVESLLAPSRAVTPSRSARHNDNGDARRSHSSITRVSTSLRASNSKSRGNDDDGKDDDDSDEEDRALAALLIAKRNARRDALERARRSIAEQAERAFTDDVDGCIDRIDGHASGSALLKLSLDDLATVKATGNDSTDNEALVSMQKCEEDLQSAVNDTHGTFDEALRVDEAATTTPSDAKTHDNSNSSNDASSPARASTVVEDNKDDSSDSESDDDDNVSIDLTLDLADDAAENDELHATSSGLDANSHVASNDSDDSDEKTTAAAAASAVDTHSDVVETVDVHDDNNSDSDSDKSFDFGDLVEDEASAMQQEQQSPLRSTHRPTISSTPTRLSSPHVKSPTATSSSSHSLTSNRPSHVERPHSTSSSRSSRSPKTLEFSSSPARRDRSSTSSLSTPSQARSTRSSVAADEQPPVTLSSSRRLAKLLESTDWSQLEANAVDDDDTATTPARSIARSPAARSSTNDLRSSATSVELIYDPVSNCYYDPVANKYYALANE